MKELLQRANGWLRLAIASSLLWVAIANALYLSGLGDINCFLFSDYSMSPTPAWQTFWYYISFGIDIAQLYTFGNSSSSSTGLCSYAQYSATGHIFFVLLPILYFWIAYSTLSWILAGFKKPKSVE